MKRKNRRKLFGAVILMLLFLLAVPVSASAKISISAKKLSLPVGQKFQLKLNGLNDAEHSVCWKVKRSSVAGVSQTGKVTAKSKGTTKVYAVVDGKKYNCKLTVTQPVTSIRLSKTKKSLTKGKSFKLKATVGPSDAYNKGITWKSSNKKVAKVNSKGKVTAVGAGTAKITACAKDGSKVKAVCKVTVKLAAVKLNMTQLTLEAGKEATLKATAGYTYVWASSDKTVVTVSSTGKLKGISAGKAVVVTKRVEDGQSVFCYVTVTQPAAQTQSGTGSAVQTQSSTTNISARAMQFLALQKKYDQQLKLDKEAGIPWIYGGGATTWKDVRAQAEKKGEVHLSCVQIATWGLRELGIIGNGTFRGDQGGGFTIGDKTQLLKYCKIIDGYKTAEELIEEGTLLPGDICSYVNMRHTNVYAGDGKFYDSGRMGSNGSYVDGKYIFSTLGPIPENNLIGQIVRIVK